MAQVSLLAPVCEEVLRGPPEGDKFQLGDREANPERSDSPVRPVLATNT